MTAASKRLNVALILIFIFTIISGCRKKAFDDYYGRPSTLAQPIYQILQSKGNFTNMLACIDKAGYKDILSAAGYWTLFAPNDSAFKVYLTASGLGSIDKMDSTTAQKIVTYSLVYNAFTKAQLTDYQANTGWVSNSGFRRRTAYYQGFYNDTAFGTATQIKALASNRNNSFLFGDNNNKYITYFGANYMTAKGLSATDYNYFYPSSTYTGFNVGAGSIVNADIVAENGYIHEVSSVNLPAPSIDQYLRTNANYSEFKKILDKYMVSFVPNTSATDRYKLLTGKSDNVYIKQFNPALSFSINNENFLKAADNDGQTGCYSMLVPRNDVLTDYVNTVILENYTSLDAVPTSVITDFVNAQMWPQPLWPSKFPNTTNSQGEPPTINAASNIIDRQVLSNGFFYGTNKVQEPNVFRTVYGRSYLDPKYLLMTRALDANYRYTITIPSLKYTVIMMSDAVVRQRGYDYSTVQSAWSYTTPGVSGATTTYGSTPNNNLQRILATHIVPTPNGELDNLSGTGIIETLGGEYIKWNNGKFISAGSIDSNYTVNTSATKTSFNGRVYYADNLLTYSVKTLGTNIKALGGTSAATSQFYNFWQYLSNSPLYNATTGDILGVSVGVFYTAFIPNNAAVQAAVNAGLLPTTGVVVGGNKTPNFAPTTTADQTLVRDFILYHLLNKTTVVPDGKKQGAYESLYKKANGDPGTFVVSSTPGAMQVKDAFGRTANVVVASSNNLADRCVIHLIDNYLQYNP